MFLLGKGKRQRNKCSAPKPILILSNYLKYKLICFFCPERWAKNKESVSDLIWISVWPYIDYCKSIQDQIYPFLHTIFKYIKTKISLIPDMLRFIHKL